jgi:hypothetical protein
VDPAKLAHMPHLDDHLRKYRAAPLFELNSHLGSLCEKRPGGVEVAYCELPRYAHIYP